MKADVAILDRSYLRRLELGRKLTGRGVLVWMVVGFGVMFAANFALIYIALSTLHGEELENPYDASQVYNQHLAEARAQDQLGWSVNVSSRQENGGVHIVADFRDRQDAMIQSLVSALRKARDYEDGALAPWVQAWLASHPEDAAEARRLIALEPRPARKIPKGREQ